MVTPYFNNIRQKIVEELRDAYEDILVAVYWFTNRELFQLLCEKLREGKRVALIIHNDYINNRDAGLDFQSFIDLGGRFYFSNAHHPMHNKFCIIDNKVLINGSYNWTYYAESKNSENILILREEDETVSAFRDEFFRLTKRLMQVDKIEKLSVYELEDYNSLSQREYLVNDLLYQASATNNPELIREALKILPNSVPARASAVNPNLYSQKRLANSIGIGIKNNELLIGIEKGSSIPVQTSLVLVTIENNQSSCYCVLYSGDDPVAGRNRKFLGESVNLQKGAVKVSGLPLKPAGSVRLKINFSIDIYGQLRVKLFSLDNGRSDLYVENVANLLMEPISDTNSGGRV